MARGLGFGLLASACACLLDGTSIFNGAHAFADDASDYTALVMGHAFLPQPDATYMQEVIGTYVDPTTPYFAGQPTYNVVDPVSVYTPETDYGSGLTQGVGDLDQAIQDQLTANNPDLVVFGYSMSTAIETQEMINLAAEGNPDVDGLKFVLAENLQTPNGGFFTRFPDYAGANLPVTPADTPYTTDIYSIEYSGASDFPQYDGNFLADLNAADGYVDLHPYLLTDWPAYFTPSELAGAVAENTSAADVNTDYYMIPTQDLPLLNDLRGAPGAESTFADLMQPDMRVLVDLGYNWTGDADVDTPATMSNPDVDMTAVDSYLAAGADQGVIAALVDMGILPQSDLPDLYPYVPDVAGLEAGALTSSTSASDALAALDASDSASALASDLANSSSPLASELSAYLPGFATDLADYFQSMASFL
ncbi:PE-PPE domain-containing protein [Mycobacterium sp.]|uniref:PE-PPE domain-containing protein n=1 Tax=Mycobacterium sp. TaxID=1785 RepID=UPI003BAE674E